MDRLRDRLHGGLSICCSCFATAFAPAEKSRGEAGTMSRRRCPPPLALLGLLSGAISLLCAAYFWVIVIARRCFGHDLSRSDDHACLLVLARGLAACLAVAGGGLALAAEDGER